MLLARLRLLPQPVRVQLRPLLLDRLRAEDLRLPELVRLLRRALLRRNLQVGALRSGPRLASDLAAALSEALTIGRTPMARSLVILGAATVLGASLIFLIYHYVLFTGQVALAPIF
jgi:hypothetical protein